MANAHTTPISPVTEKNHPDLTFSAAAIEVNQEPVELDSTPVQEQHPQQQLAKGRRRGSKADASEGLSGEERAEREKMIRQKLKDPAVLVDIPKTPHAEEFEKSPQDAEAKLR